MTVTLFFFIRNWRPLACLSTMPCLRFWIVPQFSVARAQVLDAERVAVFHVVVDFGIEKQGLSRDAADVQAGAAEVGVFLDEGGLQAQAVRREWRRCIRQGRCR